MWAAARGHDASVDRERERKRRRPYAALRENVFFSGMRTAFS